MTDDLVKRLRAETDGATVNPDGLEAADRIEQLKQALLDVAQYVSRVDLCHFVEPETRKILNEIFGETDD